MTPLPLPLALFGLHVDFGHYSPAQGRWLREPSASFTCRSGCSRSTSGAANVGQFCRAITAWHLASCPARKGEVHDHSR